MWYSEVLSQIQLSIVKTTNTHSSHSLNSWPNHLNPARNKPVCNLTFWQFVYPTFIVQMLLQLYCPIPMINFWNHTEWASTIFFHICELLVNLTSACHPSSFAEPNVVVLDLSPLKICSTFWTLVVFSHIFSLCWQFMKHCPGTLKLSNSLWEEFPQKLLQRSYHHDGRAAS